MENIIELYTTSLTQCFYTLYTPDGTIVELYSNKSTLYRDYHLIIVQNISFLVINFFDIVRYAADNKIRYWWAVRYHLVHYFYMPIAFTNNHDQLNTPKDMS